MLKRHWILWVLLSTQVVIWATVPRAPLPTITAIAQIEDMRYFFDIGQQVNTHSTAPQHLAASLLTAPAVLLSDDPYVAGQSIWLIVLLLMSTMAYLVARRVASPEATLFTLFSITFGQFFYTATMCLSTETLAFALAFVPLLIYTRRNPLRAFDWGLMGVFAGLAVLTRPEYVAAIPVYVGLYIAGSRELGWKQLALLSSIAVVSTGLTILPQLIWVKIEHGVFALVAPYESFTFMSMSPLIPDDLWRMADEGFIRERWVAPVLSREYVLREVMILKDLLLHSIFIPQLTKILILIGLSCIAFLRAWRRWETVAIALLGFGTLLAAIVATILFGVGEYTRHLWISAPFLIVVAGIGFTQVYTSGMLFAERILRRFNVGITIRPWMRATVLILALVVVDRMSVRYQYEPEHRQRVLTMKTDLALLKEVISPRKEGFHRVAAPTMQIPFSLDAAYIFFPAYQGQTASQWISELKTRRPEFLVFYPEVRRRLPDGFRREVTELMRRNYPVVHETNSSIVFKFPPVTGIPSR